MIGWLTRLSTLLPARSLLVHALRWTGIFHKASHVFVGRSCLRGPEGWVGFLVASVSKLPTLPLMTCIHKSTQSLLITVDNSV